MFYAQFVLSKKGPLAKIWLAAHWEKKLTKNQVYETNVDDAVSAVLEPKVKMALRTTGHLLLGIVRIYSRKAKYLLADCNEAFLKIKMAFRPGQVDLPEEGREASGAAINLPEVFADFDSALPDFDFDNVSQMAMNQSRIDDITMKEDLPARSMDLGYSGFGDDFGDEGMVNSYDSLQMGRDPAGVDFTPLGGVGGKSSALANLDAPLPDDFGGGLVDDGIFMDDIFNDEALLNMDLGQIGAPGEDITTIVDTERGVVTTGGDGAAPASFNLDPLEASVIQNLAERAGRGRRKRRLVVDEIKNIPGDEMKAQLQDYSDLIRPSVFLAPPTKRLMAYDGWGAEKVLAASTTGLLTAAPLAKLHALSLQPLAMAEEAEQERAAKTSLLAELHLNQDHNHDSTLLPPLPEEPMEEAAAVPSVSPPRSPSPALASPNADGSPSKRRKSARANRSEVAEEELEESGLAEEGGEKKFTKRTAAVLQTVARLTGESDEVTFTDVCGRATRKTAAAKFYTLLTLKKLQQVELTQELPYGPIAVGLGPKYGEIPIA